MPGAAALSILEAIPLPAVLIGTDKRIIAANGRAKVLRPQLEPARPYVMVLRQPVLVTAIDTCLASRETQTAAYDHDDEGRITRFEVSCAYVTVGGRDGALLCLRDVTEEEQAGQIRRDFVANVSHELRTPLTALMGFIETLRGPARDDAEARERFLGIMQSEAERMNRLVGDLLSLSRVESEGRMRPRTPVDIGVLLKASIGSLTPVAKDRGVTLKAEMLDQPLIVPADADQMTQVFTNLIENAVKYGGSGGTVTVRLSEVERDPTLRQAAIRIDVTDTGPGIPAIHIPRLTERFYRVDSHRSRAMGGTGLGLAIVKHILNRHRGRLKIDSTVGLGSTFSVILPKA